MLVLNAIIADCGDGSNTIEWSVDPKVKELKQKMANDGESRYASGDGLQCFNLKFKTQPELDNFIELNCPYLHTMDNLDDEW